MVTSTENAPFSCDANSRGAVLNSRAALLFRLVDHCIQAIGIKLGAEEMMFPPLIRISDLAKVGFLENFPHLGQFVTESKPDRVRKLARSGDCLDIAASDLTPSKYGLQSAACYNVYLHLAGARVRKTKCITTSGLCFRNEREHDDCKRLAVFHMREVVFVGTSPEVKRYETAAQKLFLDLVSKVGIDCDLQPATDPFFEADGPRARLQKLQPVKYEFVFGGLALGSTNFHRNFFGERCKIRLSNGAHAFSGCFAVGLERLMYALLTVHDGDVLAATRKVRRYLK